jgi:hypothetical protein
MEISEFKQELRKLYINRDVDAIIRTIKDFMQAPEFAAFFNKLCSEHKIASASVKLEEIAAVLVNDVESSLKSNGDEFVNVTYLDISAELEKLFGQELSDIYISTKMASEFLLQVRAGSNERDVEKLSDSLVNRYRDEMIRIEKGRQVVSTILQKYSNFPLNNATTSSRLIERLTRELKSNYKYLTIKPYLMAVFACGEPDEQDSSIKTTDSEDDEQVLFKHYLNTGVEPSIGQQLQFRLAVNNLFRHIKENDALPEENFRAYVRIISRIWGYRCPSKLTQNARAILEELMVLVNRDQQAILKRLALTFIEEYRHAEDRMKLYHNGIQSELAITREYLSQLAKDTSMINSEDKEKIRIAQEKMIGLDGVFEISPALRKAAAGKQFLELERTSLGLSTSVGVDRLTEWIRIYSILYSNSEFLEYTEEKVDFSTMRKYISDLSTYHLILNIAQLKEVIDHSLTIPDDEKVTQFTMFNEALKLRLQNLMVKNEEEKSLREMIDDLGFLGNQSLQFVIAETFEGFQKIADAFTNSATDYFVHDKEALLKESNDLYKQICNQCMKNFLVRPIRHEPSETGQVAQPKRSWLSKLFS